jgi:hypothetical protein
MTENSKAKKQTTSEKAAILATTKRGIAEEVTGVTLPPAPADRVRMVTWEGHEYAVDPTVMDDVEVLELLADMEEKPYLFAKFVRLILGDEPRKAEDGSPLPSQWESFKEDHKDANGRLTVTRLGEFMTVLNKELEALGN